jgi:tetratricopeptide (TPR) repeat protein
MDPWEHVKAGHFQEAVEAYSQVLETAPSSFHFHNRGIAYVNLGQFDRAQLDFEAADQARTSKSRSDAHSQWIGIVQWLAGKRKEATETWHQLVLATEKGEIGYTDLAGGVLSACLLWFAAVRLNDDAVLRPAQRLLRRQVKKQAISNWPGPIAMFLLERISQSQLHEMTSPVPTLNDRQRCQVEFYVAVQALENNRREDWDAGIRRAAQFRNAMIEREYYLAKHEVSGYTSSA